jgi:tricorn protease
MKNHLTLVLTLVVTLIFSMQLSGAKEARLLRFPDIHNDQIVFVYAGNLWTVKAEGGIARKLTSFEGQEIYPKFSPDGEWVAFSGEYDGNADIYKIPAAGGEPVRLTYHPSIDKLVEWTPDGKDILFISGRESYSYRFNRLFKVSAAGKMPQTLPLPTAGLASYSPDAKQIAYNRMERENRTWKRYKGGMAQDIWIYDFARNSIKQMTTYDGTDNFPMWHGDKIYFLSDRDHTANIFYYDVKSKKISKVTNHTEYDVKWPSIGKKAIVYENGGYIYRLDLASGKSAKVPVQLYDDKPLTRSYYKKVGSRPNWYTISPDGKRALFGARGEIFTIPAKKGETRNLTKSPGANDRYPLWSPDGKWILYVSDKTGEYEFYLAPQDGKGKTEQITKNSDTYRYYGLWAPDSKKFVYADLKQKLYLFDINTKTQQEIDYDPKDKIRFYRWSADSNWIVYTKSAENNYRNIWVYSLEQKKAFQLTGNMADDSRPFFDPEGKYLYFLSSRTFQPTFSDLEFDLMYKNTTNICVATLRKDIPSPFAPESDEVEIKKEKDKAKDKNGDKKTDKKDKGKDKETKIEALKIDVDGFEQRIVALPIKAGNYWNLYAVKDKLFYLSRAPISQVGPEETIKPSFHVFDMEKREDKKVIDDCSTFELSADGKKMIYRSGMSYFISDAGKKAGPKDRLNTANMEALVNPKSEWAQMFNEAWRLQRDFFYDPGLHQVDWNKIKKRYQPLVPHVAHRSDLNYILGELIGELNCGHAYVGGGDIQPTKQVSTGLLGCDFIREGNFYKFGKIYIGENWTKRWCAPLTQPGIDVRKGMYLIAVNGQKVKAPENLFKYFFNLAGKSIEITVNDKPSETGAKTFNVVPLANDQELRYLDWVETNRKKVAEATNGQVGYVHVPDTAFDGHNSFVKDFLNQVHKKGLVVDVRYNSGGFVPDRMLEYMRRPLAHMVTHRYSGDFKYPQAAVNGHFVCIANAWSGSGGDLFPWYFKHYKIGKLIGKRTWGGLVGLRGNPSLMDGGYVTTPNVAFYTLERKWQVEGHGVEPDIEVDNRPDLVIEGKDPQLEKAIEVVMKEIKTDPKIAPKRPDYPDKK